MGSLKEIIYWINELAKVNNSVEDSKAQLIEYIKNIIRIKIDFINGLYQDSLFKDEIIYCYNESFSDEGIQHVIIEMLFF